MCGTADLLPVQDEVRTTSGTSSMSPKLARLRRLLRSASLRRVHNLLWSLTEQRLRVSRPRSYPLALDVILTKACNLNCTFCVSSTVEGERWLPFELYERIARDLFPYAWRLSLCSGGEPLLYPRLREALQLAGRHRLHTSLVSNGMLLNEQMAKWIVADQNLHEFAVSFDGATKATLEGIRRGANFEKIIANVTRLGRLRQDAGAKFPKLQLRYSVMRQNAEELPRVVELSKSMGVESITVSYVKFTNDIGMNDSLFFHPGLARNVFQETAAQAEEHGIAVHLPALPGERRHVKRCSRPWWFLQVGTDGSLHFCYRAWIQPVGNIRDGFRATWWGDDYRRLRCTLHTNSPHYPYCRYCEERNGTDCESAHYHKTDSEVYQFSDNAAPLSFNTRKEESSLAFTSRSRRSQVRSR